jgi:hypothetical protein
MGFHGTPLIGGTLNPAPESWQAAFRVPVQGCAPMFPARL